MKAEGEHTLSPLANSYFSLGLRVRQLAFYLGIRERLRDRVRHLWQIIKVHGFSRRSVAITNDRTTFRSKDARHGALRQI